MDRTKLPDRRTAESFVFTHDGQEYHVSFASNEIGPLELFIDVTRKIGSGIDIMAKDLGVVASLAFQHGVQLDELLAALSQERDGTMRGPLGEILRIIKERLK